MPSFQRRSPEIRLKREKLEICVNKGYIQNTVIATNVPKDSQCQVLASCSIYDEKIKGCDVNVM